MHGTKDPPANCPHFRTIKSGKPDALEMFNPNYEAYFHESTSPLFNEKGEVSGTVIVARDVTQQKTDGRTAYFDRPPGIYRRAVFRHRPRIDNPLTSVIGFFSITDTGKCSR